MHGAINFGVSESNLINNLIKTDLNLTTVALKIVTMMMMEEHFNKNHGFIIAHISRTGYVMCVSIISQTTTWM